MEYRPVEVPGGEIGIRYIDEPVRGDRQLFPPNLTGNCFLSGPVLVMIGPHLSSLSRC